jgi:hypothetical protein
MCDASRQSLTVPATPGRIWPPHDDAITDDLIAKYAKPAHEPLESSPIGWRRAARQ